MKQKFPRPAWLSYLGAILLLAGTLRIAVPAAADEPSVRPPQGRRALAIGKATESKPQREDFLNKIPYVNRLFKQAPISEEADEPVQHERIGIDFDFTLDGRSPMGTSTQGFGVMIPTFVVENGNGILQAECLEFCADQPLFSWGLAGVASACEGHPACQQTVCATPNCGPACAANKCCDQATVCFTMNGNQAVCQPAGCPHGNFRPTVIQHALQQCGQGRQLIFQAAPQFFQAGGQAFRIGPHVVQAAAQGELCCDLDVDVDETAELLPELLRLAVENAKLETALEMQAERDGSRERLFELAVQNAKLEAQLEFANQKMVMLEKTMAIVHENALLKARVTMLERHLESQREAKTPSPAHWIPAPPVAPSVFQPYAPTTTYTPTPSAASR